MLREVYYRITSMKHYDLRKALFIFFAVCSALFLLLFWQQSSGTSKYLQIYREAFIREKKVHLPQWTWKCVNQHCERHPITPSDPIVSLSTCSMLCGSTQLWPQPTGPVSLGSRTATFKHQQLQFKTGERTPVEDLLQAAIIVFTNNIISYVQVKNYTQHPTDVTQLLVSLHVGDPSVVKLKLDTDESYKLVIRPNGDKITINITGKTFFGVRHGLETLSQLIWWDEYTNNGMLRIIKGASIQDAPAFHYRGLMIDTARNFMSLDSLKTSLDGMAANKLNVFHWHISDSQSFPLSIPSLPQLAQTGAYGQDMIYTAEDVKSLVEYALVRGIRVIIEVDTPAHAGNGWTWGPEQGLGNLAVCVNQVPWMMYCGEPPCGQLNPENPKVYAVLQKLYRDLLDLTDEREIFHIGGDEVNLECWADHLTTETLKNYNDLHDLWGEFMLKAIGTLEAANQGPIPNILVWSSNLSKRPYLGKYFNKSNIIVQSWGASQWPETSDLISDGYKVLISHVDAWYLDCGFGRWRETGTAACDPYKPWQTFYTHRPWGQPYIYKRQIIGGESCLWTEQVDENSLDARLWPRAAAFAERMWSDPPVNTATFAIAEDVYTRLNTQRERLVSRGLRPEALWPLWCLQNPGMCL